MHYTMLGNQNVLPMDSREVVQEKKRLMEFLAALKRALYATVQAPVKLYLAIISVWGCNPTAARSRCLLHRPDCLHQHACLGASLLAAPPKLCVLSSRRGARRASSKPHVVGSRWIIPGLEACHRSKERAEKKILDTVFNCINSFGFIPDTIQNGPAVHPLQHLKQVGAGQSPGKGGRSQHFPSARAALGTTSPFPW